MIHYPAILSLSLSCAALAVQAASAAAEMEQLRQARLGLPALPDSAARRAAVEAAADDADAAAERARRGLVDLGRQWSEGSGGDGGRAMDPTGGEAVHVAAGRRYIASMSHESIPLGYLQVGCGGRVGVKAGE